MGKFIDLTGMRFGRLTVIRKDDFRRNKSKIYWKCICDCGNEKSIEGPSLRYGLTTSCGCYLNEISKKPKIDLVGKRFEMLTVLSEYPVRSDTKHKEIQYLCKCDCGNEVVKKGSALRNGYAYSCGCVRRYNKGKYKHGYSIKYKRLYSIRSAMLERCNNPNRNNYKNYGNRGITVCEDWENSPKSFVEWALSNGYDDNLELDRIDNDKGYSPDNCRWITKEEQNKNKRNNVVLNINGNSKCVSDWEKDTDISRYTIYYWVKDKGKEYAEKRISEVLERNGTNV